MYCTAYREKNQDMLSSAYDITNFALEFFVLQIKEFVTTWNNFILIKPWALTSYYRTSVFMGGVDTLLLHGFQIFESETSAIIRTCYEDTFSST